MSPEFLKVKLRSKSLLLGLVLWNAGARGAQPGEKRTIITSGEKVHSVHFQLGQSTVFYLGFKPETVICGNNNYFHIEKIKEGVTVQPLANFATNLSILDKDRRYLFYLSPASGAVDSFLDVRWVEKSEIRAIEDASPGRSMRVVELNQRLKIDRNLELVLLRKKISTGSRFQIYEVELENRGNDSVQTKEVSIFVMNQKAVLSGQMVAWEKDECNARGHLKGRFIFSQMKISLNTLVVRYRGYELRSKLIGVSN